MSSQLTNRQFQFITALIRQLHISERTALHTCPGITHEYPGGPPDALRDLTLMQASYLIVYLLDIRDGHKPMPALPGQTSLPIGGEA